VTLLQLFSCTEFVRVFVRTVCQIISLPATCPCTPACLPAGTAADTLGVLFGGSGLGSSCPGDVVAAQLALGSAMSAAPGSCLEPLLDGLGSWLDRCGGGGQGVED
jgi:hypothetical protein